MEDAKPGKALCRNGWIAGSLVAASVNIAVLAVFRDAYRPFELMLLLGLPVGISLGVFVGLAVEGQTIPRKEKYTIGLVILAALFVYVMLLVLYLLFRTG